MNQYSWCVVRRLNIYLFRSFLSSRYCSSDGRQSVGSGQPAIPIPASGILRTILGLLDECSKKSQTLVKQLSEVLESQECLNGTHLKSRGSLTNCKLYLSWILPRKDSRMCMVWVMWQPPCPITSARAGGHRTSTCDSQDDHVWGIHRGSDSHPKQMLSKIGCQYVLCICCTSNFLDFVDSVVHFSVTVSLCFSAKCPTHTKFCFQNCLSRWWFPAFSEFSPLLREMIEID